MHKQIYQLIPGIISVSDYFNKCTLIGTAKCNFTYAQKQLNILPDKSCSFQKNNVHRISISFSFSLNFVHEILGTALCFYHYLGFIIIITHILTENKIVILFTAYFD